MLSSNNFLNHLPRKVRLVEVGPRDGLQNEKTIISLEDKFKFIKNLSAAGLHEIEATSFVRAEKIPQMSDGNELFIKLSNDPELKKNKLISLVPNAKGMETAIASGVQDIAIFTSTSNSFNLKNINATIDDSLVRISEVVNLAKANNIKVRGYISTVFGCPYEGKTSLIELKRIAKTLIEFGIYEISLGDTIGIANPLQVKTILTELENEFDLNKFALHFHDTRGMAVANVLTALELGMTNFDSSAAGLGGCPYAVGASGNVATEDLVFLFHSMGIETGVDLNKLAAASVEILSKLNRESPSKYLKAYLGSGK